MDSLQSGSDIEDGEVSDSSEGYTPLQRPATLPTAKKTVASSSSALATCQKMQNQLDVDEEDLPANSSSDSSADSSSDELKKLAVDASKAAKNKRKHQGGSQRTVMVRVPPNEVEETKRARFKKYNIWTEALQEEALTETMRGFGVTRDREGDRNVENYDYTLRYRLNGNSLKRRLSNSTEDMSEDDSYGASKRSRTSMCSDGHESQRPSVKSRLGHRPHSRRESSGSDNTIEPRLILDLKDTNGRAGLEVAQDIANKLNEQKDDLLVRIVEVLGIDLPIEVFKETQRIEAAGGMMIQNGRRRRTPGGVFLFLLKHHERLALEDKNKIFSDERNAQQKLLKKKKARSRDRKVEELKKRLSEKEKESALSTRNEHILLGADLAMENAAGNLSNPPPSPVGQGQSPDYNIPAINHVAVEASPEKPTTSRMEGASLGSLIDDVLDLDYDDMIF